MATRRVEHLQFDHGAQFVTAKGAEFAAILSELTESGAAANWDDGSGRVVTVGRPGMSALAKALAADLDVRLNSPVTSVTREGRNWRLRAGDTFLDALRVVITAPAPQATALIGADHALASRLAVVRYAPCLTLLAASSGPASLITSRDLAEPLSWIAQDSSKPGRPATHGSAWVAQASPAFSQEHLERDMEQVTALMLPMLCDRAGLVHGQITYAAAHRWRYAAVTQPLGQPFLRSADATLHLGGDWCVGPRVEAAWTSGTAIAEDILASL